MYVRENLKYLQKNQDFYNFSLAFQEGGEVESILRRVGCFFVRFYEAEEEVESDGRQEEREFKECVWMS